MLALSTKQSVNFAASLAGVSFIAALFGIATIFSDIADLESELSRHQSYYLNVSNTMWKELMDQSEEIRIAHTARRQRRQYDSGYKASGGGGGAKTNKCPGGPKGPKGPPGERGMDGSDGLPGLPGNGASMSTDPYSGAPQALLDCQEPTASQVKKVRKARSDTKETREVLDKRAHLEKTRSATRRVRLDRRVNAAILESLVMKDCPESVVMTQASVHQAHKGRLGLQENRARTESKGFQERRESQHLAAHPVARRADIAVAALLPAAVVVRAATAAVPLPLPRQHLLPQEADMAVLQAAVAVVAQLHTMELQRARPRYSRLRGRPMCRKSVAAAING
ncbi:nematode cuticle collagen domain-containing protein [Aphelenchoides avenae]|nr:nematode cuticle collagen domain-containing protein [Aphelenchus avenae]